MCPEACWVLQESSGEQRPSRAARVHLHSPYVKWRQVSICLRGKHSQSCHLGAYGPWDRRKCPTNMPGVQYHLPKNVCYLWQLFNFWRKVERGFFLRQLSRTTQLYSISCNYYIQRKCIANREIVPCSQKYGPRLSSSLLNIIHRTKLINRQEIRTIISQKQNSRCPIDIRKSIQLH